MADTNALQLPNKVPNHLLLALRSYFLCLHHCMASAREQGKTNLSLGKHAAWWPGDYKDNKD